MLCWRFLESENGGLWCPSLILLIHLLAVPLHNLSSNNIDFFDELSEPSDGSSDEQWDSRAISL